MLFFPPYSKIHLLPITRFMFLLRCKQREKLFGSTPLLANISVDTVLTVVFVIDSCLYYHSFPTNIMIKWLYSIVSKMFKKKKTPL